MRYFYLHSYQDMIICLLIRLLDPSLLVTAINNLLQLSQLLIGFNYQIINKIMPFWSKKKEPAPSNQQPSTVVIMHSDVLGMTVIEDDLNNNQEIQQLSHAQWIDVIESQELSGFPFERIYFSFLKGIPDFLRMKIWLLLCSENSAKKFHYTSKNDKAKKGSGIKISELTVQIYNTLCANEPMEKQVQQIEKDVKRSFSVEKAKYKYLAPLLRKLLYASSNSGIQYSQGMNYILLNIIIYCLQSLGVDQNNIAALHTHQERDIFVIFRETVIRMDEVFGENNIFKVMHDLQQKIAQSFPQILYIIYNLGMDCFSTFSQNYYSVMSYNDPPQQLCKQMLDLFFLTGQKAIHATIIRMLQITEDKIMKLKGPENLQKFMKNDIYHQFYKVFLKQKETAKSISDFGLCFFDSVQRLQM